MRIDPDHRTDREHKVRKERKRDSTAIPRTSRINHVIVIVVALNHLIIPARHPARPPALARKPWPSSPGFAEEDSAGSGAGAAAAHSPCPSLPAVLSASRVLLQRPRRNEEVRLLTPTPI